MYKKMALLLLIQTAAYAMDGANFFCDNELCQGSADSEIIYIRGEYCGYNKWHKVPELYDKFYLSLAGTVQQHDTTQRRYMHNSLFIQLCVQAAKATMLDQKPLQELFYKIRVGIINHHAEIVRMTEKDLEHRLLSYIPCGKIHALVNDKKVQLGFVTESEVIKQPMPTQCQSDLFPEDPSHGCSWMGHKLVDTGEQELKADYDFTSNQAHHAHIVEAFNKLLGK